MKKTTKCCSKCNKHKILCNFYKKQNGKYSVGSICKDCCKIYRGAHKEKTKLYNKKYREENLEKLKKMGKEYRITHKDNKEGYDKNRYIENSEEIKKRVRLYVKNNKEKKRICDKNYRIKNKSKLQIKSKKWRDKNRVKINNYTKYKLKNNIIFKLKHTIRSRITTAIKNQSSKKTYKSIELLGCTIEECRKYLESQFQEGMTWENHGVHGWHIDHIRPCSSFDLTDPEQQKECFNYKNLQPLWAEDNLSKGDKWNPKDFQ